MAKPFLSFEDQLNKLENEKGLVINNREYAEKKLREIGYFGLFGGYKSRSGIHAGYHARYRAGYHAGS